MRTMVVMMTLLASSAALAQTTTAPSKPPMIGDRPLVQVKPRGEATARNGANNPAGKPSIAAQLQGCLEIEDGSKERLDCYDAIYPPKPKTPKPGAKQKPAKAVSDCRLTKEEDERLACYNGFAQALPKPPKT
ncbi:hypothetical protein SR870_07140 [Rhodopseudomonas palustris]|uniref:hypothetical protein n=1 Tax=Rhodopseudomonas palustris TaxID=1076 RepID=UPI002ACECE67|nr:hypothetical protein [Rhodopseudomonas palustris]WQH01042.1 hypothetical protein SR870_07140 [Rhodopseudomonas palustris]